MSLGLEAIYVTSIQRRIKTYVELLKFCQLLINSHRGSGEKKPDRLLLPLQFPPRDDQFIITDAARRKVTFISCAPFVLSPSPADSSSRFFACRTMYTRVTRSDVSRRTGATTNLFAASSRCISTPLRNWFRVALCQNLSMDALPSRK